MDIVLSIIELLSGLGAFFIGFKMLSENVERVASRGLRKLFSKTSNRFIGVGVGIVITALLQSSSVTTVMVVGFVNSNIMNLFQATAIIMGANIGSTITAQIVALQSFNISAYAIIFTAIGMFMNMLCKKGKYKSIGLAIAGFGLVFLSLTIMKNSMEGFKSSQTFVDWLQNISNPFLLLLIGMLLTGLLQSSAAVTTIIISMVGAGIQIGNGGNSVLFVIIGTNIGTCITALLSSFGASPNAKRASLIHLLFNVFAAVIFIVFLLIYKDFMNDTFVRLFASPTTQIAMFHTFFNIVSVMIFLPFIKVFVLIVNKLVKDKDIDPDSISHLDDRLLTNPSVALTQATTEVNRLGELSINLLSYSIDSFVSMDTDASTDIKEKTVSIDKIQENLLNYLVKISANNISSDDERLISVLHNAINDLYRLVEISDNMVKYTRHYIENDLDFSSYAFEGIIKMKEMLDEQFKKLSKMLLNNDVSLITEIDITEDEIDTLRSKLMNDHMNRLERNECKIQNSSVFINLVSNLERAGDHLNYIAHALYNNYTIK